MKWTEGGVGERLSQTPATLLGSPRSPAPWIGGTGLSSWGRITAGQLGFSACVSFGEAPNPANVRHREILKRVCYYLAGKILTGWIFRGV